MPRRRRAVPLPLLACTILLLASLVPPLGAQEPARPPQPPSAPDVVDRPLRVFLDCQAGCDREFLVTELPYLHFVRDRNLADVHVLLTSLGAASGGEAFTLTFQGQGAFGARVDTIVAVTPPNATDDAVRTRLRQAIAVGLLPYAARTSLGPQLDVRFEGEAGTGAPAQPLSDPWNNWVFEAGVEGSADVEQRQRSWRTEGDFRASRITERWKVEAQLEGEYSSSEFELSGGREATNTLRSYGADALIVRSLSDHLSVGFTAAAAHSEFYNQDLALRVGPALEYNFLDWDEATRQRVTLRYSVGLTRFDYIEQTIYLRTAETIVSQHVALAGRLRQPWGSVNASVDFGNVVDEPSKNVLTLDAFAEVRILTGLNLFVNAEASRVRNQLYLPRGDLTDEEILLGQRALATDYRYELSLGLSYTFGSIYNTIVNPRFGDGIDIF